MNARLGQLQARLRLLSMVDMTKIPRDRVGLGSTVTVLDTKKDEEVTYKLVTSEEADVAKGLISTTSPIGQGLLDKEVGDVVSRSQSPGGVQGTRNPEADHDPRRGGRSPRNRHRIVEG